MVHSAPSSAIAATLQRPRRSREDLDLSTLSGALAYFFRFSGTCFLLAQIIVALLARALLGGATWVDGVIVVAVSIYWPLQEWGAHIALLHAKPKMIFGFKLDPYYARCHRHHHRNPKTLATALLPRRALMILAPIHLLFWWAVTPTLAAMATGVAAFTTATLFYEWIHYLTHTHYRPKGRYLRTVFRNHRMHHYRNEKYWHSFTAPFLDTIFGTGPDAKDVPRSETCHDLGVPDEE
jgi:hypothetical protein